MTSHPLRRSLALLTAATLLASLAAATVASPASAAKPKCFGKTATIVGTAMGEVIKGTPKADVIVARGGHDRIYGKGGNDTICANGGNDTVYGGAGRDLVLGGLGRDQLLGNAGSDRLLGGPGNDAFDGGIGVDLCAQGTGTGPMVRCERPPAVVLIPALPGPLPMPKTLAIAYSDIDDIRGPSAGDVMISQLVDTNLDGVPSAGDTIEMGRYPGDWTGSVFGDWGVKSHTVTHLVTSTGTNLDVDTLIGRHQWESSPGIENYIEIDSATSYQTTLQDSALLDDYDHLVLNPESPSHPEHGWGWTLRDSSDDRFLDVDLSY